MDEAIENEPENVQFLMNRAQCYFELQHFTESIQDLERALEVDENDPKVLYKLGLSYYAFDKYKRCIKKLKKALKCKSLGKTIKGKSELSSARANQYLTYESDIYYHIGIAYSNLERFEESIFPLTKAIK